MKVLFVCKGNVGRSQMANAFFNKMSKNHSTCAGTNVGEHEGEKLHESVINIMAEEGYDLSKNERKQLTPEMSEKADKIIVMTEKENLPEYVNMKKVVLWNVQNPKDKPLDFHRKTRNQIKRLVEKLIKSVG